MDIGFIKNSYNCTLKTKAFYPVIKLHLNKNIYNECRKFAESKNMKYIKQTLNKINPEINSEVRKMKRQLKLFVKKFLIFLKN